MHKFLLGLCLVGCLSVVFAACLQAAEAEKAKAAAAGETDENWFQPDTDSDKNIPDGDITMITPRPSEIINSGLAEVSQAAGLIADNSTAVAKPECDNPRLLQKVLDRIAKFYSETPVNNIIDKRRQTLMLKNLRDFKELDISAFDPKENYDVSDQIIAYKINKGIKQDEMRLCRSTLPRAIYLLIYPQNNFYTVEIINFPGRPRSQDFTTVYD